MKCRSKSLIIILFTSVFLLGVIIDLNSKDSNLHNNVKNEDTSLKSSDNEITINTPDNITYTEPMSGYYPGSIGFEDDIIGTIPDDWWYHIPDSGSFYRVVSEWQAHKNVYEIRKNGGTQKVSTSVNFASAASAGSVDFWLYKDTDSNIDPSRINLEDGYESDYFTFGFDQATLYIGTWQNKQQIFPNAFSKNVWHYVKVDFNFSLGWQVQIDDTIYGEGYQFNTYVGTPTQVMNFQIESIWSGCNPNYGTWVDAIGYSWDPNYNIGDNKNEGMLLGYNNNTNLSWQGYSFDGQANNTIYGNYTIPFPSNGHHSIQVFGNDTSSMYYESDLRHFTVNYEPPADINIITPENIVYNEPMSGYYPATYGFENDIDGNNPDEWMISEPSGTSIQVENEYNGHKKVLSINDWGSSVESYTSYSSSSQITQGTIEFWFCAAGTSTPRTIDFRGGNGNIHGATGNTNSAFNIYFDSNTMVVRNGSNNMIANYIANQWYHIRIDFECTNGGYYGLNQYETKYYVDGENKGIFNFWNIKDYIEEISFESWGWGCQTNEKVYFDDVGFSWDPNYNIGDNLNESLLLSYDSIPTLDWQGYSVDGQENVTIIGNTTLPMLSNGLHSIQVFGNDSIGNNYESNLIYFTVSFNNNVEPELTNGNVSPRIGDQTTEFNFTVTFWDEDNSLPSYVNVVINGTTYAMEKTFPSDDNYTDGCYYEYTTFLLPSEYNYTYYFECGDGKYNNATTVFFNLKVNKENYNSPQLLFPEVSPDYGGLMTDFLFKIWYYDLDDNYPLEVNITIDTSTFSMIQVNPADTNATDGIEFSYITNLDYGIHNFRFNCSDGLYSNSTNLIIGPEVNPLYGIAPIELLTPSAYSQIYNNSLEFSWYSLDAGFGAVNFTLQVSDQLDFSHIIFQSEDIVETPIFTNYSVPLSITHGQYYWRVRPTYGNHNGSWSDFFSFTFHINNYSPNLVLDDITPTDGTSSTIFRFTVIYSDLDNNAPEYVEILINGITYSMELVNPLDEDFTDGCIYQYLTLLTPSTIAYTISFECFDGGFYDSTNTFTGPLVESEDPPNGEQGLNNLNSTNIFALTMMLGIPIGIIIPFIAFAEIKVRKMKLGEKSSAKIKKKVIKS